MKKRNRIAVLALTLTAVTIALAACAGGPSAERAKAERKALAAMDKSVPKVFADIDADSRHLGDKSGEAERVWKFRYSRG